MNEKRRPTCIGEATCFLIEASVGRELVWGKSYIHGCSIGHCPESSTYCIVIACHGYRWITSEILRCIWWSREYTRVKDICQISTSVRGEARGTVWPTFGTSLGTPNLDKAKCGCRANEAPLAATIQRKNMPSKIGEQACVATLPHHVLGYLGSLHVFQCCACHPCDMTRICTSTLR